LDETIVEVNGERVVLDSSGAAWWPDEETLVFADLHFEKGSFYALTRQFLPPYDTRETLTRMATVIARYKPGRIIALGDSFHDRQAAERFDDGDRALLARIAGGVEWIWIAGNHDPAPPEWLGGRIYEEIAIGGLLFRHEPSQTRARGEVAGHLHPCATVVRRGHALRRRCFVSDGKRIVLPSFGAYTGGLNVNDDAIASLFPDAFLAYMLGARRVYTVATSVAGRQFFRAAVDAAVMGIRK
jgi:DNA ligase-associated metallophosphoesterase